MTWALLASLQALNPPESPLRIFRWLSPVFRGWYDRVAKSLILLSVATTPRLHFTTGSSRQAYYALEHGERQMKMFARSCRPTTRPRATEVRRHNVTLDYLCSIKSTALEGANPLLIFAQEQGLWEHPAWRHPKTRIGSSFAHNKLPRSKGAFRSMNKRSSLPRHMC